MAFVLQAVGAVAMKEILTNQVLYILRIPEATSQDSGVYECVVVNDDSREIRTGRVVVTVFGTHYAAITNTQNTIEQNRIESNRLEYSKTESNSVVLPILWMKECVDVGRSG